MFAILQQWRALMGRLRNSCGIQSSAEVMSPDCRSQVLCQQQMNRFHVERKRPFPQKYEGSPQIRWDVDFFL
ncbi:hypothetical protein CEXT_273441 [Caerostris extrusa]|uniref:Uncharacterized protein n=1 Tax=Caerostris extrusa TaxID=172846 RepID=A0AAV4PWR8_CAEEX|nr:hypothetical protein CEXT_273441 [Caerostris extrusa]